MITARQFILACVEVFPHLEPPEVAECFRDGILPSWPEVERMAESMADSLTPTEHQTRRHARLYAVAECARQMAENSET